MAAESPLSVDRNLRPVLGQFWVDLRFRCGLLIIICRSRAKNAKIQFRFGRVVNQRIRTRHAHKYRLDFRR